MENIQKVIKNKKKALHTVNSNKNNKNTVNCNTVKQYRDIDTEVEDLLKRLQGKPEYIAKILAEKLDDQKSLAYFTLLAKNTSSKALFEALSYTLDADSRNKIRTTKAIYFMAILRRWKIPTKFKRS